MDENNGTREQSEIIKLAAQAGEANAAAVSAQISLTEFETKLAALEQLVVATQLEVAALAQNQQTIVDAVAMLATEPEPEPEPEPEQESKETGEEIPPPAPEPETRKRGWA